MNVILPLLCDDVFETIHTCLSPILKLVASLTSKNKAHIL